MLPLAKPALATCALFQFLHTWNDFFGPLLYIDNPDRYTLAYGLQQFMSSYGGKWAQLMAGASIFTVPIILLFFFAQKTFIQGISTTGSKA
jgi:multiple sugar transport system permease protein